VLLLCDKKLPPQNIEPSADFTYSITDCNKVQLKIAPLKNIKTYKWDLGDNSTAAKEVITHQYKKEGSYNIKLIASATNGKEITVTKNITITKPDAAFSYTNQAQKNTIKFNISNKQKLKYKWFFGDGQDGSNEKNITHTYQQPGTYKVLLIAVNKNGCSDTAQQTITIATPVIPVPDTLITKAPDTAVSNITVAALPEKRENNLLKEIAVTSDSVSVSFYDNAEIDGDSVTIVYNNNIIVTHLFLTDKAKTFMLPVDKSGKPNELIMYAENLGSIPPNTALMIVYDGSKRHEVSISSSKSSNGMVRFIFTR
jgi:PKD repeat protein